MQKEIIIETLKCIRPQTFKINNIVFLIQLSFEFKHVKVV